MNHAKRKLRRLRIVIAAPIIIIAALLVAARLSSSLSSAEANPVLEAILTPVADSIAAGAWACAGVTAPEQGCPRLPLRHLGAPIGRLFSDSNAIHLANARGAGIRPVESSEDAWNATRGLVKIRSCSLYYIQPLTHSYPYLTRNAADLLQEICSRFRDSLQSRGGGSYRPKVTSVLRTRASVGRLRRVNRNAISESAHCYGTTFDISHSKFICDDATDIGRTFEDLKNLLAEVVADMRAQGRCVVKFERRQACLHITVCDSTTSIPQQ